METSAFVARIGLFIKRGQELAKTIFAHRITESCLCIFNSNGTIRKCQKSKILQEMYLKVFITVVRFGPLWDPTLPNPPPPPPQKKKKKFNTYFFILSNFLPIIKNKMRINAHALYQQGQGKIYIINGCSLGHFYKKNIFTNIGYSLGHFYKKKFLTNIGRSLGHFYK